MLSRRSMVRLDPARVELMLHYMYRFLRLIISHSVVHDGPGFPFFAPFVFWHLASWSEQTALPYVSVNDLSNSAMQIVKMLPNISSCSNWQTFRWRAVVTTYSRGYKHWTWTQRSRGPENPMS